MLAAVFRMPGRGRGRNGRPWTEAEEFVLWRCVESARSAGRPVKEGCARAAGILGRTVDSCEARYQSRLKGRGLRYESRPGGGWTPVEDEVLRLCVERAGRVKTGAKVAAGILGRTWRACEDRYRKRRLRPVGQASPGGRSLREDLARLVLSRGRLTKEDIGAVARRHGVHYHTALSLLGWLCQALGLPVDGEAACYPDCPWRRSLLAARLLDAGVEPERAAALLGATAEEAERLAAVHRAFGTPRWDLGFAHHAAAAATDDPEKWLALAAGRGWTPGQLAAAAAGEEVEDAGVLREQLAEACRALDDARAELARAKAAPEGEGTACRPGLPGVVLSRDGELQGVPTGELCPYARARAVGCGCPRFKVRWLDDGRATWLCPGSVREVAPGVWQIL
jgi:hypothetical protein